VYDLLASAGAFGPDRPVGTVTDERGWIPVPGNVRLTRDHFVARVSGHSMEPTIPGGAYGLFRADRGGSREGKLVLVWHRGSTDPALGGEFSVKRYRSVKDLAPDGTWTHREIRLEPLNPVRHTGRSSFTRKPKVTSASSASSSVSWRLPAGRRPSAAPTMCSTTSAAVRWR
jgi:hypothetical protein